MSACGPSLGGRVWGAALVIGEAAVSWKGFLPPQVETEPRVETLQRGWPGLHVGFRPCHQGARQLQGEVDTRFLVWQMSVGLDFPICIMDWRLSEGPAAQTICVHLLPQDNPTPPPYLFYLGLRTISVSVIFHIPYRIRPMRQEVLLFPFTCLRLYQGSTSTRT